MARIRLTSIVALAALGTALAAAPGAGGQAAQQVSATVEAQFGAAVAPDGTVVGSSSTIPVQVTRERVGGTEIVTIVPLK